MQLLIITEKDLCSVQTQADCLNPGPPSLPPSLPPSYPSYDCEDNFADFIWKISHLTAGSGRWVNSPSCPALVSLTLNNYSGININLL